MEKIFETSRRSSRRPAPGGRAPGGKTPAKKVAPGKKPPGRFLRFLRFLLNSVLILAVAVIAAMSGIYGYVIYFYGDQLEARYPDLVENSAVYDANGERVAEFKARENRRTVDTDSLGEYLPQAVVAIEDRRFYEHYGIDPNGIGRAAWHDLRALAVSQGGSTITEQLMKNLFISEERRVNISPWRRIEQAALSVAYERRHTKEEILTSYLNTVYFGNGAYGAEEAAETYFGKSAQDLTVDEAAALAGFLDAPSTYLSESGGSTDAAVERRDEVLRRMHESGRISTFELREAEDAAVTFVEAQPPDDPAYEPFVEAARREVEREMGAGALERGGLQIYTTLEPDMQNAAIEATEETLYEGGDPSGAVASVEPQSGAIKALSGKSEDFNLPLDARRQPGSSFKPFVLATALREFVSPDSTYYVSRNLGLDFNGEFYPVKNYDGVERGRISLSQAMAESDNTVHVQLAMDLGLENVSETAGLMGITTPVDPYPSTAIGGLGTGVSALEMASAYATFAANGIHREPYAVERIDRSGFGETEAAYDHKVEGRRVLSANQAAQATEVLRRVVQSGTASFYHDLDEEIGRPSAGKTGTSEEFADAWYVGYTSNLSTAVWVGYPEGRTPMLDVHDEAVVNGETLPMDLWSAYMAEAVADDPALEFPRPNKSEFVTLARGYAAATTRGSSAPTASSVSSAEDVRRRNGYSAPESSEPRERREESRR